MKKNIILAIAFLFVFFASSVFTVAVLSHAGWIQPTKVPESGPQFFTQPDENEFLSNISQDPFFTKSESSISPAVQVEITREGIQPGEFRVTQGEKVTLVARGSNVCQFLHPEEKKELVSVIVLESSSEQGVFIGSFGAPPSGTYIFSCNVPGHAEQGITGTMIVEEE